MIEGVDYAFSYPSEVGLYAAGKRFAGRYIGPGSDAKHLHAAERDRIFAAGLDIMLLVEGQAGDCLLGRAKGIEHARSALAAAAQLGAPGSTALYFAADKDISVTTWPQVRDYLEGAASIVGLARVGLYGERDVMMWAARDRATSWFFQTYAWSGVNWWPGNHVEQYRNGVTLAGGTVDLCRAKVANFGQWIRGGDPLMSLSDRDAQALIWRAEALIKNLPTVAGGPTKGEPNQLHAKLEQLQALLEAPDAGGGATVTQIEELLNRTVSNFTVAGSSVLAVRPLAPGSGS